MKRISELIGERYGDFTRGQRLLAGFISDHCDRAAFMTTLELAAVTGVSQSTVVRFASAMGFDGYQELQQALRDELKYRLDVLERFEVISEISTDDDVLASIAATDAMNIKKTASLSPAGAIRNLITRLHLSSRVYIYGQGMASAAAIYLSFYLRTLLPGTCCLNQMGTDFLTAMADIDSGDLFLCLSFPLHSDVTKTLLAYARHKDASIATISESEDSETARLADVNLVSEWGDYGVNGSLAPVISLCCAIVCLLARNDEHAEARLKNAGQATQFHV